MSRMARLPYRTTLDSSPGVGGFGYPCANRGACELPQGDPERRADGSP